MAPVSQLDPVVPPAAGRTGICCSGGGIRSASFNLGALQAIQCEKRLQKVRFLPPISGGSFIAAAFAMVANGMLVAAQAAFVDCLLERRR